MPKPPVKQAFETLVRRLVSLIGVSRPSTAAAANANPPPVQLAGKIDPDAWPAIWRALQEAGFAVQANGDFIWSLDDQFREFFTAEACDTDSQATKAIHAAVIDYNRILLDRLVSVAGYLTLGNSDKAVQALCSLHTAIQEDTKQRRAAISATTRARTPRDDPHRVPGTDEQWADPGKGSDLHKSS